MKTNGPLCLLYSLLLAVGLVVLDSGCSKKAKSTSVETSNAAHDPAIIQPRGQGRVSVTFRGLAANKSATLFRIDANEKLKVKELIGGESGNTVELESGFYMAELDGTHCKFPVPALASFIRPSQPSDERQTLSIQIDKYPQMDEKWT